MAVTSSAATKPRWLNGGPRLGVLLASDERTEKCNTLKRKTFLLKLIKSLSSFHIMLKTPGLRRRLCPCARQQAARTRTNSNTDPRGAKLPATLAPPVPTGDATAAGHSEWSAASSGLTAWELFGTGVVYRPPTLTPSSEKF